MFLTESSNLDSQMRITFVLDDLAVFLSSSILDNRLLTLRRIKWNPFELKYFIHFEAAADHYEEDL